VVNNRIRRLTAAVEGVADPHNTAAVIRTAEAFGLETVHIIENDASFRSTHRVTRGTHKWIDFSVWKNPDEFAEAVRAQGKIILAADARAERSLYDLDSKLPTALVLGNERKGISDKMRALSDGAFFIPMKGFAESLNVSVAAAVSISTLCRKISGDLCDDEKAVLKARYFLRAVSAGYDIAEFALGDKMQNRLETEEGQ
jgi:tRNA (guanosine-2'-O-)-methyltransferase